MPPSLYLPPKFCLTIFLTTKTFLAQKMLLNLLPFPPPFLHPFTPNNCHCVACGYKYIYIYIY